nr:cell division protein ftsz like 2-2, chloroplastic [Quercus suber]
MKTDIPVCVSCGAELQHKDKSVFFSSISMWVLSQVNAAAEVIYDLVDPTANLIFGAVIDPSLSGQVSITLIATGFKRQEESEGRPLQASQLAQGDVGLGFNRRPPSFTDSSSVEIPDFLKKKGRSRYPRV